MQITPNAWNLCRIVGAQVFILSNPFERYAERRGEK